MILLVNLLVIIGLGFFSADISNQFVNTMLETAPHFNAKTNTLTRKTKEPLLQQKQLVIQSNIFNSEPEPEEVKQNPAKNKAAEISGVIKADVTEESMEDKKKLAEPTRLRVKLKGTIVGENNIYIAIIEDMRKRSQALFRINDTIQDDVKIVDIERNKVYIIHDGKMELLEIYSKKKKKQKKTRAARNPKRNRHVPPATPQGPAETELSMIIDKAELDEALTNIPQLLTQARIIPSFSNGKSEGFKIFNIKQRSIFEKVGLRNGDILVRINENEIKDPQKFLGIFQQLKNETSIVLDLVRKGTKQTISYDIR